MSTESESISKMSASNLKKKIAQYKKSNAKLKQMIAEDQNKISISDRKAEQKFKEAQDAKTAREKVQQEIDQKVEESKRAQEQAELEFKEKKNRYMTDLRQIKSDTLRYTKMAEAAASELFKLESYIGSEFKKLKKSEETERMELQQQENTLHQLELHEAHLLKLVCMTTPGVPPYTPPKKKDHIDIYNDFHAKMADRESQIQIEKQISQLRQLRQRLQTDIDRLQSGIGQYGAGNLQS
ncbi:hypothetical protein M9Y10_039278 [Tritrichomonas musculus]|uniref:Uncharacterized protein n=1 Tax=Tritrichomonas musculus TaxID=1915356 RepID=A0ABR2KAV0_9EUKA